MYLHAKIIMLFLFLLLLFFFFFFFFFFVVVVVVVVVVVFQSMYPKCHKASECTTPSCFKPHSKTISELEFLCESLRKSTIIMEG